MLYHHFCNCDILVVKCNIKLIWKAGIVVYVLGSFLKESILYNEDLAKKLINEITSQNLSQIEESDLRFGYGYYKPALFLECQTHDDERIYLAVQEVYESTMETITTSEFLLKDKQDEGFAKEILVCINFAKDSNSEEFIEKKLYDEKLVFSLNIFNYQKEESILKEFCLLVQDPLDEEIMNSSYDIIKEIAYRTSVKMNKNQTLVDNLEGGFRDRVSAMNREKDKNNLLFNKAVELYCKSNYDKEFVADLFSEYEGEDFFYYLDLFKKDYETTKKLLEAGVEKDVIIDDLDMNKLIFCYAKEKLKG